MKRILAIVLAGGNRYFCLANLKILARGGGGGGRGGGGGGGGARGGGGGGAAGRRRFFPSAGAARPSGGAARPSGASASARPSAGGGQKAAARPAGRPRASRSPAQRRGAAEKVPPLRSGRRPPRAAANRALPGNRPSSGQLNSFLDVAGPATGAVRRRGSSGGRGTRGRRSGRFPARRGARKSRRGAVGVPPWRPPAPRGQTWSARYGWAEFGAESTRPN